MQLLFDICISIQLASKHQGATGNLKFMKPTHHGLSKKRGNIGLKISHQAEYFASTFTAEYVSGEHYSYRSCDQLFQLTAYFLNLFQNVA